MKVKIIDLKEEGDNVIVTIKSMCPHEMHSSDWIGGLELMPLNEVEVLQEDEYDRIEERRREINKYQTKLSKLQLGEAELMQNEE